MSDRERPKNLFYAIQRLEPIKACKLLEQLICHCMTRDARIFVDAGLISEDNKYGWVHRIYMKREKGLFEKLSSNIVAVTLPQRSELFQNQE